MEVDYIVNMQPPFVSYMMQNGSACALSGLRINLDPGCCGEYSYESEADVSRNEPIASMVALNR